MTLVAVLCLAGAAQTQRTRPEEPADIRLPSGKSQADEILKADHAANIRDLAQLMKLAEEVKIDIEKSERYVLNVKNLRNLEEIEKISKRIRSRMRRF